MLSVLLLPSYCPVWFKIQKQTFKWSFVGSAQETPHVHHDIFVS